MIKPALTHQQQLDLLKSRGLLVPDEPFALHILAHHNYYRLSAYRFSFTVPGNSDLFRPGTSFGQIWELYHFDRSLRQLMLEACKRIEISARSHWAYVVGHRLGPLAYTDPAHFIQPWVHAKTLAKLVTEMDRSDEDFIHHHRTTLGMDWPPAWVLAEVASFGNISTLIGQIKDPSLRQKIADTYQLDEKVFTSLLHHLCLLRNTAAHHSRLWNRSFTVTFKLPRKKPASLAPNFNPDPGTARRIHNSLIMLMHMVRHIEPAGDWPMRLAGMVAALDPALICEMGFPPDWRTRDMWKAALAHRPC